jgi:hypothetical protein
MEPELFKTISIFSGAACMDPYDWIQVIDSTASLYGLSADQRLCLALARLSQQAARWARANRGKLTSWASFQHAFLARFAEPPDKLWAEYSTTMQGLDESASDYAERLSLLRTQLNIPSSGIPAKAHFVDGLRPRLRHQVKMQREVMTLADAVAFAIQLEHRMPDLYGPHQSQLQGHQRPGHQLTPVQHSHHALHHSALASYHLHDPQPDDDSDEDGPHNPVPPATSSCSLPNYYHHSTPDEAADSSGYA